MNFSINTKTVVEQYHKLIKTSKYPNSFTNTNILITFVKLINIKIGILINLYVLE